MHGEPSDPLIYMCHAMAGWKEKLTVARYLIIIVEPLYIGFWGWEGKGVGLYNLQKSLSTPAMLWFSDTSSSLLRSSMLHHRHLWRIEIFFLFLSFLFHRITILLIMYAKCSETLRCCRYTKQAILIHYNQKNKLASSVC